MEQNNIIAISRSRRDLLLGSEMFLLFGAVPWLIWWLPLEFKLLPILLALGYCYYLRPPAQPGNGAGWQAMLLRFLLLAGVGTLGLNLLWPELMWQYPDRPLWLRLCITIAYPALSVLPQEFLFRRFFFTRYQSLFSSRGQLILTNALLFSWAHITYGHGLTLLLTFVASFLFAHTYLKSKRLLPVVVEHSLYGLWALNVGFAPFFYLSFDTPPYPLFFWP